MTKINGKIISGYGYASQCVPKQKPFLEKYLPEIASMHNGTLNIRLEQPLAIEKYDVETDWIQWDASRKERFYLLRAKIEFPNTNKGILPCVIYNATTSAYLNRPFFIEVLMQAIDKTGITDCCVIIEQPTRIAHWIIVG